MLGHSKIANINASQLPVKHGWLVKPKLLNLQRIMTIAMLDNLLAGYVICLVGFVLLILCLFHRDSRGLYLALALLLTGVAAAIWATKIHNQEMKQNIQRDGPALIEGLINGEPMLMQDRVFPVRIAKIAESLGYSPNVVARLANRTNYTIVFHPDGVFGEVDEPRPAKTN